MRFFILLSLIVFTSCSLQQFKPYRVTIGPVASSSEFKLERDGESETVLCVESSEDIKDVEKCSGGGFKKDQAIGYIEPWIEFTPNFFESSHFGWSYFFAYNQSSTTLLEYPLAGEKTRIDIERFSLNPFVFYNWGDKIFKDGKGMALRAGLGASLSYVSKFDLKRDSTQESFEASRKFKEGTSIFVEYSWNWFIFRIEHSAVEYDDKKFRDIEKDTLKIQTNKVSLLYSYYF
ncbi:MAG: hypothetical protein KC478_04800 [Bacteriovoracaceae bacterium]|nr:hypothetical protein [Bacteriovoracaceae bacterium]